MGNSEAALIVDVLSSFGFLKAGVLCVVLAVLELSLVTRLASQLKRSACLCLTSARIKGVCHLAPLWICWIYSTILVKVRTRFVF